MTHRLYLFLFFMVFFLLVFVLRSYLLWRNTGINPITFGTSDDAHGFNGQLFKYIFALELIVVIIYSFFDIHYDYLLPFWYLEINFLQMIGWALLHFSLIWIFTAQLQMADSWRIGIDEMNKTELKTKDLFTISRNPIFFGILIADLGIFLVIPNAFTLLVAALSFSSIQTQVRLEEAFLMKEHKEAYSRYFKQVRRWI